MSILDGIEVQAIQESWSGHGEGGVTVKFVLVGAPVFGSSYNSTNEDFVSAQRYADDINAALREVAHEG